ncbi:glucolactonase [Trypanosoma theileri]|uniref:Glucolactonase n=1 Tax=Trypanosoma theileri TaxID=67003 RepID=A0A1X0NLF1_9TRYP|nr:glucolactonase [Trypanosoma theileri]ORC85283.1 glucolactonase [Trypanosoma theileri]
MTMHPKGLNRTSTNLTAEKLWTGGAWLEGPCWLPREGKLLFSDVAGDKQYLLDPDTKTVSLFRPYSSHANGNTLDFRNKYYFSEKPDYFILSCEHGRRCISASLPPHAVSIGTKPPTEDVRNVIIVDKFANRRFNSPNDIVVRSCDGSVWFTDPPYGILSDFTGMQSSSQIVGCFVYCLLPPSPEHLEERVINIAISDCQRPNGLAFTPDEKQLYVADMSRYEWGDLGRHEIRLYDIVETISTDGKNTIEKIEAVNGRRFFVVEPGIPDGFRVDGDGYLYTSSQDAITIVSPEGKEVNRVSVPEHITNCTFGGPHENELYVTSNKSIFRIQF